MSGDHMLPVPAPSLEPIAMAAMDAGRMLMEAGANSKSTERIIDVVARGLGAERVEVRIGYASLAITIGVGDSGITRMCKVGHLGVNDRLDQEVWALAKRLSDTVLTPEQVRSALARLANDTLRHPRWLVALSVGLACAAFGRLFGVDWQGSGAVLMAATIAQYVRSGLLARGVNAFLCATLISCLSSALAGAGARLAGSETFASAMVASILMLVPGVPSVNAQTDILEGRPTLGSARFATVLMTLIFMAAGLWIGQAAVDLVAQWT